MKCFHVHYLIWASATEVCARQGGRPHHSSVSWLAGKPWASGILRKKEFPQQRDEDVLCVCVGGGGCEGSRK